MGGDTAGEKKHVKHTQNTTNTRKEKRPCCLHPFASLQCAYELGPHLVETWPPRFFIAIGLHATFFITICLHAMYERRCYKEFLRTVPALPMDALHGRIARTHCNGRIAPRMHFTDALHGCIAPRTHCTDPGREAMRAADSS